MGVRSKGDTMKYTLPIVTLAAILTGAPAVVAAQPEIVHAQWGQPRSAYQRSYDDGYRAGLRGGERDARSGRRPDYRQHDEYRRGSNGWGWGNSNRAATDVFRRGFAEGYRAGYERLRGYGRPGYPDYRGSYGYPGGYDGPRSGYGYYSPAAQRGFDDGYKEGRKDGRDNDRYEPTRKKKYREGDDGYNSRYGSKERYKAEYRQAFQQGYERGYREGRYSR